MIADFWTCLIGPDFWWVIIVKAVIVIVLGGPMGSGFSVQAEGGVTLNLPAILRGMADQIERDVGKD